MPVYTYAEAMTNLSSVTTLEQLIELATSVDASAGDSKLILYGGGQPPLLSPGFK